MLVKTKALNAYVQGVFESKKKMYFEKSTHEF